MGKPRDTLCTKTCPANFSLFRGYAHDPLLHDPHSLHLGPYLARQLGEEASVPNLPVVEIPFVNTTLQAFLPQLVLLAFILVLLDLLLKLSKFEGIPSKDLQDRAAAGKFFYFNVFNVFLGVTIAGSLFTSLKQILSDPTSIVSLLSKSLPGQATFFISFVALR